ncbi:MAG: hypothetical protein ABIH49_02665 [archaeon]
MAREFDFGINDIEELLNIEELLRRMQQGGDRWDMELEEVDSYNPVIQMQKNEDGSYSMKN